MPWRDFIDFDIQDIADRYGDDALQAIQDEVESLIEEFQSAISFADSDEEKELAQESLEDFMFTESEAESLAEDYEIDYLTNAMYGSYKSQDIIERYLEIVGGGGGGYSPPPTPVPKAEPVYVSDYEDFEYDYEYEYAWDYWTEDIQEVITDFFSSMFGVF